MAWLLRRTPKALPGQWPHRSEMGLVAGGSLPIARRVVRRRILARPGQSYGGEQADLTNGERATCDRPSVGWTLTQVLSEESAWSARSS